MRTSIQLPKFLWDFIDSYKGILGTNRSNVIGTIVLSYLNDSNNRENLESLRKDRSKILEKYRRERDRKPENLEKRIKNFLEISDRIPLKTFITHLNIDIRYFHDNLYNWAIKYNFRFEDDIIFKNSPKK